MAQWLISRLVFNTSQVPILLLTYFPDFLAQILISLFFFQKTTLPPEQIFPKTENHYKIIPISTHLQLTWLAQNSLKKQKQTLTILAALELNSEFGSSCI